MNAVSQRQQITDYLLAFVQEETAMKAQQA